MVLDFFHGGPSGFEQIERRVAAMLNDCRHSFDLAMGALAAEGDIGAVGDDVRETDRRINAAEEDVRKALVVHAAVRQNVDVALILTYLLVVKKLERVGDQNKNIFDLAAEGVRLSGGPDSEWFERERAEVSRLFAAAGEILAGQEPAAARRFNDEVHERTHTYDEVVNRMIHSEEPASVAVPRTLLARYLKRICANLASIAITIVDPIERGTRDLDD